MRDRSPNPLLRLTALCAIAALTLVAGCGTTGFGQATPTPPLTSISVSIPALPTEDLVGSCFYDLLLQQPTLLQRGVLVIFERGDTAAIFQDPLVQSTALSLQYAMVWAHECDSISSNDLQANAAKGPARALIAALTQFAQITSHPELASDSAILYGFSAAGALSITMANTVPQRILGIIPYAPGSASINLDQISPAASAAIPALILGNALDNMAGTSRGLGYFHRGRALAAPWAYAVQNATGHCCSASTRSIIVPWITAIATAQASRSYPVSTLGSFQCTPDGTEDAQGETDCRFTSANIGAPALATEQSGWLPDAATAAAWLAWVTNPQTN